MQALEQEEASLYHDRLFLARQLVPAIVYPSNQLLHIVAVEWGEADQELEEHAAEGPRVHRVVIPLAFQQLGRLIKRRSYDCLLRLGVVKNFGEPEI